MGSYVVAKIRICVGFLYVVAIFKTLEKFHQFLRIVQFKTDGIVWNFGNFGRIPDGYAPGQPCP